MNIEEVEVVVMVVLGCGEGFLRLVLFAEE